MGQGIGEYFADYHHPVVGQQDLQRGKLELRSLLQISGPKQGLCAGFTLVLFNFFLVFLGFFWSETMIHVGY